jgi:hypothetical protein
MEPDLGGLEGLLLGDVRFFFIPKILSIENIEDILLLLFV